MVRKDGAEARKERISKIATTIQASLYQNKDLGYIPLNKTIAKQELETGLTREKILEYLAILVEADQFEVDHEKGQIRKTSIV